MYKYIYAFAALYVYMFVLEFFLIGYLHWQLVTLLISAILTPFSCLVSHLWRSFSLYISLLSAISLWRDCKM